MTVSGEYVFGEHPDPTNTYQLSNNGEVDASVQLNIFANGIQTDDARIIPAAQSIIVESERDEAGYVVVTAPGSYFTVKASAFDTQGDKYINITTGKTSKRPR